MSKITGKGTSPFICLKQIGFKVLEVGNMQNCWLWGLKLFPLPRQCGCLLGKMERKRGEISLFYFIGDYFPSASMDDDVPTASASGRLVCHVGNRAQFYRKQEKPLTS